MIQIAISDQQTNLCVDEGLLCQACSTVLKGEGVQDATISIAIVDNRQMHKLNREFLNHDYETDVLSFVLDSEPCLDGEVIASSQYAIGEAKRYDWKAMNELTLYIVHGTLHLVGYDDVEEDLAIVMREKEQHYMQQLGLGVPPRTVTPNMSHSSTGGDLA